MRDDLNEFENPPQKSPEAASQANMRPKLPKRFYKQVSVEAIDDGFVVLLDGKSIKTPGRNAVLFPTREAGELAQKEWQAQETEINPLSMPVTRIINTAIDGVANDPQAVLEDIVKFASSDLLYYRASTSPDLIESQIKHWDPILDWAAQTFGAHFETGEGIAFITQPKDAITRFSARLSSHSDPVKLACLHTFTTLTGSALIALGLAEDFLDVDSAWAAAHVDEDHNIALWGEDEEAKQRRQSRFEELKAAFTLLKAL